MRKKRMFKDVIGAEPADYFLNHFRQIYPSPPVNLEGESLSEIWLGFKPVEQRFIHHLVRVYGVWREVIISRFQGDNIIKEEMTELQLWVVKEKPDFSLFLGKLNTHFATKEKIFDGINRLRGIFDEPVYINAFELACYFFLLAHYCITPEQKYPYYNALIKANEFYGQFKAWIEMSQSEGLRLKRKVQSSKGGKNTARKSGAVLIRNELVRILTEKVESSEKFTSKVKLSEAVAPELYAFILEHQKEITIKSRAGSAEELAPRINDWIKRNRSPYEEICALAGKLIG